MPVDVGVIAVVSAVGHRRIAVIIRIKVVIARAVAVHPVVSGVGSPRKDGGFGVVAVLSTMGIRGVPIGVCVKVVVPRTVAVYAVLPGLFGAGKGAGIAVVTVFWCCVSVAIEVSVSGRVRRFGGCIGARNVLLFGVIHIDRRRFGAACEHSKPEHNTNIATSGRGGECHEGSSDSKWSLTPGKQDGPQAA